MSFSETLYDLKDNTEFKAVVKANSANDMINGTFSYLMLGLDREWYENACRISEGSKEVNDRELLNMWTSGSETSIVDAETIKLMNAHRFEPDHVEIINNYAVKWYVPESVRKSTQFHNHHYILGMDGSENIGEDFTTLVMINVTDMSVVCTFRCNESNIIKIGMFIAEFLISYPTVTFIPESNSTGRSIIDVIALIFQKHHINPYRRIYNEIVQKRDDPTMSRISLDDPDLTDTSLKKYLGFRTTSKTRPFLYKNTLIKAAKLNATRIKDINLVAEISALSVVNGRIDHSEHGHDDMVIAYLLACWLLFFGENLHYYGLDVRSILMSVTADGSAIDPAHRDQQLDIRRQIKQYEDLIGNTTSPLLKNTYRQNILLLQDRLDHGITIEPVASAKINPDVMDYGKTLYTPQEFARSDKSKNDTGDLYRRVIKLLH